MFEPTSHGTQMMMKTTTGLIHRRSIYNPHELRFAHLIAAARSPATVIAVGKRCRHSLCLRRHGSNLHRHCCCRARVRIKTSRRQLRGTRHQQQHEQQHTGWVSAWRRGGGGGGGINVTNGTLTSSARQRFKAAADSTLPASLRFVLTSPSPGNASAPTAAPPVGTPPARREA